MQPIQCITHPGVAAADRCTVCGNNFCGNCLVLVNGRNYCGYCKMTVVQGQPLYEQSTIPSATADEALKWAIFSLFCCGIILGPMAVYKGFQAKKQIAADPILTGDGKATAAIILGFLGAGVWILLLVIRLALLATNGFR